ncbi:MAG: CoA-binding protein [Lentisphaerae bacterium]|nr:CoA-binding protein [Lentisphaerota bacterium]
MNVAVLGASNKQDRYSYKAVMLLKEKGHSPYPIHPMLQTIEGIPVFASLRQIPVRPDVVTVYLAAANQENIAEDIIQSRPRRVIFNPGAENPALGERLESLGIEPLNACTLVLLHTEQFEITKKFPSRISADLNPQNAEDGKQIT